MVSLVTRQRPCRLRQQAQQARQELGVLWPPTAEEGLVPQFSSIPARYTADGGPVEGSLPFFFTAVGMSQVWGPVMGNLHLKGQAQIFGH